MDNIMTRLEGAKGKFSDEKFLSNKGLSNEAGIHIFCYDPREEMVVRSYFADLIRKDMPFRLVECDLYKIFLQICEDKRILDRIPMMENKKGSAVLLKQLRMSVTVENFIKKCSIRRIGMATYC